MYKMANCIVDELLVTIVEMHPNNLVLHTFLSYNLSLPSLSPVTSLIIPTNDGPVLLLAGRTILKLRLTSDVPPHSQQYCV